MRGGAGGEPRLPFPLPDAFKTLRTPAPMRERYGFPPLTRKAKRRILGLNAARLYGVDPRARRCAIAADRIALERAVQGGVPSGTEPPRVRPAHTAGGPRLLAARGVAP